MGAVCCTFDAADGPSPRSLRGMVDDLDPNSHAGKREARRQRQLLEQRGLPINAVSPQEQLILAENSAFSPVPPTLITVLNKNVDSNKTTPHIVRADSMASSRTQLPKQPSLSDAFDSHNGPSARGLATSRRNTSGKRLSQQLLMASQSNTPKMTGATVSPEGHHYPITAQNGVSTSGALNSFATHNTQQSMVSLSHSPLPQQRHPAAHHSHGVPAGFAPPIFPGAAHQGNGSYHDGGYVPTTVMGRPPNAHHGGCPPFGATNHAAAHHASNNRNSIKGANICSTATTPKSAAHDLHDTRSGGVTPNPFNKWGRSQSCAESSISAIVPHEGNTSHLFRVAPGI